MCHSVEFYMPRLARQAAEHRLGAPDLAAAGRERAAVGLAVRLWTWLRGRTGRNAARRPAPPRAVAELRS